MDASQLATAAATAATEGGTAKAAGIIKEIAKLSVQLSNEQLQAMTAQVTLEGLRLVEQHAQKCLTMFVDTLRAPNGTPELATDAAWILYKLTGCCAFTRRWVLDAGGLAAVHCALVANSLHDDLVNCCVGIVCNLDGLRGLGSLLSFSVGAEGGNLPDRVLAVIVWAVYEQVKQQSDACDLDTLLQTVLQLLAQSSHDVEVQNACCSTLAVMLHQNAQLGALLLEREGPRPLLNILQHAMNSDGRSQDLAGSCGSALIALAEASAIHADIIRQYGGVEVLALFCIKGLGGADEEVAMCALGHLGGLRAVVEVMSRAPTLPAVIRGGLDSITELASSATAPSEVQFLPEVLGALWLLLEHMNMPNPPVKCRKKCIAAICSGMIGIATHAEPTQVLELDQAVVKLVELQRKELCSDADIAIAEITVESLGRMALIKPSWRDYLKCCGAQQALAQRIQTAHEHRRLLKYTFWAAAALSGLPFVCSELQNSVQLRSAHIIDAAVCTILLRRIVFYRIQFTGFASAADLFFRYFRIV